MHLTNRRLALIAVTAAAGLVASGCASDAPSETTSDGLTPIRMAVLPYPSAFPIDYAANEGIFEENGIEVTTFDNYASGPEILAAFAAGQYDIAYLGGPPAINGGSQDALKIIGISNQQEHAAGVFVRPGTFDESDPVASLSGTDAIAAAGSNQQFLLNSCVESLEADPASLNLVNVAPANVPATFAGGDGFVMAPWAPQSYQVRTDGEYEELCDETSAGVGLYDFYVATPDFLEANPDAATAFLKSVSQVQEMMEADPDGMADETQAFLNGLGNDQSLEATKIDLGEARAFPDLAGMIDIMESGQLEKDLEKIAGFLESTGALTGDPDFTTIIDASYAKSVGE